MDEDWLEAKTISIPEELSKTQNLKISHKYKKLWSVKGELIDIVLGA